MVTGDTGDAGDAEDTRVRGLRREGVTHADGGAGVSPKPRLPLRHTGCGRHVTDQTYYDAASLRIMLRGATSDATRRAPWRWVTC
ncbi:hypothetical protein GCM10027053_29380 [Intrasporangium mesophilum]